MSHSVSAAACLLGSLWACTSAAAGPLVLNHVDAGGFRSDGESNNAVGAKTPSSPSLAGGPGAQREFFVFDLSGIEGVVESATLRLSDLSMGPGSDIELYRIAAYHGNFDKLMFSAWNPGVYQKLGNGTAYASIELDRSTDQGKSYDVVLSPRAIKDIQKSLGDLFAMGASLATQGTSPNDWMLWNGHPYQLILTMAHSESVPEPGSFGLALAALAALGWVHAQRRGQVPAA